MEGLMERFLRYVAVDTQANFESEACPSTAGQLDLARMLEKELQELGLADVTLDDYGYVMARLPKNTDKDVPAIGFLAHLDTAAEFNGKQIKPQLVYAYNGDDIVLNEGLGITFSPSSYPNLSNYIGKTLVLTDGTTLLGVDDKAGIAEIMTAMDYLMRHPEILHGEIMVAFSPDEEIGRGPLLFDVEKFGAQFAYTLDGGPLGEFQYENFNAASAVITFKGNNIHPGHAKDIMVSALDRAMEFHGCLPKFQQPQYTSGYEGYYHLMNFNGDVEAARLVYYIRDFCKTGFEARKSYMKKVAEELGKSYGADQVKLDIKDVYYNMRQLMVEGSPLLEIPLSAMKNLGISPVITPIRGGTDGAQLSYKGLLTPNLFIGGENFHGKYEFAALEDMEMAAWVIVEIAKLYESL
ncbi:MAG: peptidase T [Turicibacter sp.]|nr:peptidase T [Turicibacter sp.]